MVVKYFRHVYICNTCHNGDHHVERRSGKELPRHPVDASCSDCGHRLEYLCDVCGEPLAHLRTEDVTWTYVGRWGLLLVLIVAGLVFASLRGLVAGLAACGLVVLFLRWRDSRRPGHFKIDHGVVVEEAPLNVLRGRARCHEDRRLWVFVGWLIAALLVGVGIGALGFRVGWLLAAAAGGALASGAKWNYLRAQMIMSRDSRPFLTIMREEPHGAVAMGLKHGMKIAARRFLHRAPDPWEVKAITEAFERALEDRSYVATTHEPTDWAMLKPVVMRAVEGNEEGNKEPGDTAT
jgi:hypothetical protein